MSSTLEILATLKAALADIPLSTEDAAPRLFECVEYSANRDLVKQLSELMVTKDRVCLIVPMSVRRVVADETGAISVLGHKHLAVELLYSDRALFKSGVTAVFGGDANLGLLGFDDLLEDALTGKEVSPFGGLVLGDSEPLLLSASDQGKDPNRHAWLVTVLVPTGLIVAGAHS